MDDYLNRNFPQLSDAIQTLAASDATFGEVCSDYEDVCAWLETKGKPMPVEQKEWAHARALKQELEEEILNLLKEQHDNER